LGFACASLLAPDILPHCPFVFLRSSVCFPPFRAVSLRRRPGGSATVGVTSPRREPFIPIDPTPAGHTSAAVPPAGAAGILPANSYDAFFNQTDGQSRALASGVTFDGQLSTATLDISKLAPNSAATLIFRLVNNYLDNATSVHITDVHLDVSTPLNFIPGRARLLPSPDQIPADVDLTHLTNSTLSTLSATSPIDFTTLSDVTASLTPDYGQTSFNESTATLLADLTLQHTGQFQIRAPLLVAIRNLSDPTVRVRHADGLTPAGLPYYDLTGLLTGGSLNAGQSVGSRTIEFFNASRIEFTYELVVLGQLNRAPVITSTPAVQAIVGVPYIYDAIATDADGDALTFTLITAPPAMTLSNVSPSPGGEGVLSWTPTAADLGTHNVTVKVDDGHGGSALQNFVLTVISPPPNRPPAFTSVPVVDANPNTAYNYSATATDADSDPLTFALTSSPGGMTINPITGLVTWTPNIGQLGPNPVVLTVSDGQGGAATQSYVVTVLPDPSNHPPVIIIQPGTTAVVGQNYTYDVDAIDPDGDVLTYSLPVPSSGMTINPVSGVVDWAAPAPTASFRSIASDFASDLDGWTSNHLGLVSWVPSGGNPGGYLKSTDSAGVSYHGVFAPAKFLGNLLPFDGGTISFDAKDDFHVAGADQANYLTAIIESSSDNATYRLQPIPLNSGWTHATFPLYSTSWGKSQTEWRAILSDVQRITVLLEQYTGGDAVGFDNFVISDRPPQNVSVRVDDGKGGFDLQSYSIAVQDIIPAQISGVVYQDLTTNGVYDHQFNGQVKGTSDLWLAGMPDGSTASGGDVAPAQSPLETVGLLVVSGKLSSFGAAGSVCNNAGCAFGDPLTDPNGGAFVSHLAGAENGISGVTAPVNSLIGVFLGPGRPDLSPAPPALDFSPGGSVPGGVNYLTLAPLLKQVFYIGTSHQYTIPPGATRLFLGTMDGSDWTDNIGYFDVAGDTFILPGVYDDPTLPNWTVFLDQNNNGILDAGERFTNTDLGGYFFGNLTPGTYIVREELQAGWRETGPPGGAHVVSLVNGQIENSLNFGNKQITPANRTEIRGTVFNDLNGDGSRDKSQDLLVCTSNPDAILRYSGQNGSLLGTFASGNGLSAPQGITFGPDGTSTYRILVAIKFCASMAVPASSWVYLRRVEDWRIRSTWPSVRMEIFTPRVMEAKASCATMERLVHSLVH
jgi:hypothetical protein